MPELQCRRRASDAGIAAFPAVHPRRASISVCAEHSGQRDAGRELRRREYNRAVGFELHREALACLSTGLLRTLRVWWTTKSRQS